MGIKNLFTLLEGIMKPGNIKDFAGKKIGIDGYEWLHKAVYLQGHNLVVQNDKSGLFQKLANKVSLLSLNKIQIVLVFDGDKLPSKGKTEDTREELRRIKRELANTFLLEGDQVNANKKFAESYDVTPQIAFESFQFLKNRYGNLECNTYSHSGIVAPYEADAQLGYLSKIGYIDAVIAEDSDMLVFEAKCLITKLDTIEGSCEVIKLGDIGSVRLQSHQEPRFHVFWVEP